MNLGVGGPIDFANLGVGGSKIFKNPGAGGFFNGTALNGICTRKKSNLKAVGLYYLAELVTANYELMMLNHNSSTV